VDLVDSLEQLAQQNLSGVAFLSAYGLTWLICAVLWSRASQRTAAYATLFQGLVAFPLALGLSALLGAIGQARPVPDEITQLSILIGTSQLLGLPLLIYLVIKRHYALVPVVFATITAIHFVLYSWLYQTPLYIGMAVLIALGTTTVMATASKDNTSAGPVRVCVVTGGLLLVTAAAFAVMHLMA